VPRPDILNPLFRTLTSVKGVGPQLGALFSRFFGAPEGQEAVVLDVLMHMPSGVIDRRAQNGIAFAPVGSIATLKLHIDEHIVPPRGNNRAPLRVRAHDETGEITLIFFGAKGGWVERSLPIGETRYVSGEIGFFGREKQMTHPDYIVEPDKLATLPLVEPVYPLTHGLSSKALRKVVATALDTIPIIPEWIGGDRKTIMAWPTLADALRHIHTPRRPNEGDIVSPARLRLAYDEYLAGQLALALVRSTLIKASGVARQMTGEMTDRVEDALPFALTDGQRLAVSDIRDDLAKPTRMSRLLQGDVGSGKTVVAALAAARPLGIPVVQTFHALGTVKRRHQGAKDTSPPHRIETEREMTRRIPGATMSVCERGSHFSMWDDPKAFEDALVRFIHSSRMGSVDG
jgi:ATP-dependent DNA helicase RecG